MSRVFIFNATSQVFESWGARNMTSTYLMTSKSDTPNPVGGSMKCAFIAFTDEQSASHCVATMDGLPIEDFSCLRVTPIFGGGSGCHVT